jgi:hypothetical protein
MMQQPVNQMSKTAWKAQVWLNPCCALHRRLPVTARMPIELQALAQRLRLQLDGSL